MKNMMVLILCVYAVAACSSEKARSDHALVEDEPAVTSTATHLETLHGLRLTKDELVVDVMSYGCTAAEHFSTKWTVDEQVVGIAIYRNKKDRCRRVPKLQEIRLTIDVVDIMRGMPLYIENPLVNMQ